MPRRLHLTLSLALTALSAPPAPAAARQPGVTPPIYDFVIEDSMLRMRDGVRLSVTFVKPVPRTPGETFPVLFDFYPYRKDESHRFSHVTP